MELNKYHIFILFVLLGVLSLYTYIFYRPVNTKLKLNPPKKSSNIIVSKTESVDKLSNIDDFEKNDIINSDSSIVFSNEYVDTSNEVPLETDNILRRINLPIRFGPTPIRRSNETQTVTTPTPKYAEKSLELIYNGDFNNLTFVDQQESETFHKNLLQANFNLNEDDYEITFNPGSIKIEIKFLSHANVSAETITNIKNYFMNLNPQDLTDVNIISTTTTNTTTVYPYNNSDESISENILTTTLYPSTSSVPLTTVQSDDSSP